MFISDYTIPEISIYIYTFNFITKSKFQKFLINEIILIQFDIIIFSLIV